MTFDTSVSSPFCRKGVKIKTGVATNSLFQSVSPWQPYDGIKHPFLPVSTVSIFNLANSTLHAIKLDIIHKTKSQTPIWWNEACILKAEKWHIQKQKKVGYIFFKAGTSVICDRYGTCDLNQNSCHRYSMVREKLEREVIGVLRNPKAVCPTKKHKVSEANTTTTVKCKFEFATCKHQKLFW